MNNELNIGERLSVFRKSRGMTQGEFAQKANINPESVSSVERGSRTPSFDMIISISSAHGVSIDWLLFGRGSMDLIPEDHFLNKIDQDTVEFFTVLMQLPEDVQGRIFGIMADFLEMLLDAERRGAK